MDDEPLQPFLKGHKCTIMCFSSTGDRDIVIDNEFYEQYQNLNDILVIEMNV